MHSGLCRRGPLAGAGPARVGTAGRGGDIPAKSGILVEQNTGRVLYELNADEKMHPASITKVMTLCLVFQALDSGQLSLDQTLTASAHAASMGGSDIWLEEGESMTVDDLIKATVIMSANDARGAGGGCGRQRGGLCGPNE